MKYMMIIGGIVLVVALVHRYRVARKKLHARAEELERSSKRFEVFSNKRKEDESEDFINNHINF